MAYADEARGKLDDAQAQIIRLREQVETLMKDRVSPAMADMAGRAQSAATNAANTASGVARDQAKIVSSRVKEQPLLAVAIAAVVGWVIGRAMR